MSVARDTYARAATIGLAGTALELGDPERALALADEAGGLDVHTFPQAKALASEVGVLACVQLGRLDEARNNAEAALRSRFSGLPMDDPPWVRGAAARRGIAREGRRVALAAAQSAAGVGAAFQAARSGTLAGRALDAAGERERALAELDAAHWVLSAGDAIAWRDQAARELRRIRPTSPARGGAGKG